MKKTLLLVNFGGPRSLDEVEPFLRSLLFDQEIIRTPFPPFLHRWLFAKTARRRTPEIQHIYATLGNKSPIFFDTEYIARALQKKLQRHVVAFHRYLEATHDATVLQLKDSKSPIEVLPLFPHFSFATTGSIATLLNHRLPHLASEFQWVPSYASHPAFICLWQRRIQEALDRVAVDLGDAILLFSAHGLPCRFIEEGDPYRMQIEASVASIAASFPKAQVVIGFQSRFGKDPWLRPATDELCHALGQRGKTVFFIPISFTSDHIETLYEIEKLYLPIVRNLGLRAIRLDAFNRDAAWIDALSHILASSEKVPTKALLRHKFN